MTRKSGLAFVPHLPSLPTPTTAYAQAVVCKAFDKGPFDKEQMTGGQTTSWIFLATAIASQTGPADYESISNVADGLNHAVPTHKELQTSLTWLTKNDLVTKTGSKYRLTEKGLLDYDVASRQTSTLLKIWDNLDTILKKYQA